MSQTKHLLIESIYQRTIDRTPIWIMRQAGRYLPEYIKTKNQLDGTKQIVINMSGTIRELHIQNENFQAEIARLREEIQLLEMQIKK